MPRDSRGQVLDFHSLRRGYVTAICRANVSPRVMMELARHSDPRLTMKRYSRVSASDVVAALDVLPKLSAPDKEAEDAALRATGTDDARAEEATIATDGSRAIDTGAAQQPAARNGRALPVRDFAKSFAKPCTLWGVSSHHDARKGKSADGRKHLENTRETRYSAANQQSAPVAQLDRALVFGTSGYRFESCRA